MLRAKIGILQNPLRFNKKAMETKMRIYRLQD